MRSEELVVIPRKEYEEYLELKKDRGGGATEETVLRWSREAKTLRKAGKLSVLSSLKELR